MNIEQAEEIVYKTLNVQPFGEEKANGPTLEDFKETIAYNLVHGWRPKKGSQCESIIKREFPRYF